MRNVLITLAVPAESKVPEFIGGEALDVELILDFFCRVNEDVNG